MGSIKRAFFPFFVNFSYFLILNTKFEIEENMGSKVSIQDIDRKANSKQFLENRIHELEGELYQIIQERDDYKAANKSLLIKNSQLAQQLADCREPKELEDK